MRRPIWICVYPQQSFREAEGSTADVQFYPGEPSMAIGLPVGWRSRRGVRHLPRRPQLHVRRAMLTTTRKPAPAGEILVEAFMQPMSLTQGALAETMGAKRTHVNELCNGRHSVPVPTPMILERVSAIHQDFCSHVIR